MGGLPSLEKLWFQLLTRAQGRATQEGGAAPTKSGRTKPRPRAFSRVAKPLTEDERRAAELLDAAGLPRPPARCLVLLARGGWWLAADLAEAASLTPQEVSEGVRLLEARGALRKEPVARTGPGRPPLRYHLAGEARDVLSAIEADARAALLRDLALLDELRARLAPQPG